MVVKPASISEFLTQCDGKNGWSDPAPPINITANVYQVGSCGIVALLITSDDGHILIDAATKQAAPAIASNIERLGFKLGDIRYILLSHEHWDHIGGLPTLQKMTDAKVVALQAAKTALESGRITDEDPQAAVHPEFEAVSDVQVIEDGGKVQLGPLSLTAQATFGHAPGSTSWTWQSCEDEKCHAIVYADSLTAVSGDSYRFSDHPDYIASFSNSLKRVAAFDCDILITPHPSASDLYNRIAGNAALVDPQACEKYAKTARKKLDARLLRETEAKK
ncbi:subclass B3 metallo-beta-lactamase [Sphingorhabdus sp. Alg239-R122]|uniref:subclass B3 metallo-beta-lactamase n=1 Tax=Sphingorhabdus sp. Alg239-R122 TaxID=2305989 RepID=UPI001F08199A|nr:subclass B3 metallo-beta-lactamase [Sphingorhabdus sp. Alg239-R122]